MTVYHAGTKVMRSFSFSCYTATIRVSRILSNLQRVSIAHNTSRSSLSPPSQFRHYSASHNTGGRTFATRPASRPKAHTGRTTTSPRVRKPKAATTGAAGTGNNGTVRSTKTTTQPAAKKAKVQVKPKSKSKAKAKSPKTKPIARTKEPLSEELVAAQAAQEKRKHIRELRLLALSPPKGPPMTPFLIISMELSKEKRGIAGKEAAEKFKNLIPEELEVCNCNSYLYLENGLTLEAL